MTAAETTTPADLVFTTKPKSDEEKKLTQFELDGEALFAHKPKDSVALWIRKILVDETDIQAVVGGYEKFIHYVFPEETRVRLFARLEDPDDLLDVDDINLLMNNLFVAWGVIDKDGNPVDNSPKPARKRVAQR